MPVYAVAVEVAQVAPANQEQTYQAAVAARQAGQMGRALAGFEQVLAQTPENVDARLNMGLTLLALGRLDEAEQAFERVLQQTPDYIDARIGLARVARRRGQMDLARQHTDVAMAMDPSRPDTRALYRDLNGIVTRWDIDLSQSQLSGGQADWTEQRIGVSHSPSRTWTLAGAVERTERFGLEDILIEARAARRWQGGHAYFGVAATPDADYRPEQALLLGGSVAVSSGWELTLDASRSRYPVGTVSSLQPGVAAELAEGRLRLAGRWIQTWDELDISRQGYALSATWRTTDRFRLRADFADAPESSSGATLDVQARSIGFEYDLTQHVSVRGYGLSEDRGAVDRNAIGLGLGWRY